MLKGKNYEIHNCRNKFVIEYINKFLPMKNVSRELIINLIDIYEYKY